LVALTSIDRKVRRPWTALAAAATAAHHGYELSSGLGIVLQPELGLVGASVVWGTQLPLWFVLAVRDDQGWDRLLAVASGFGLAGALVHFWLWPWRLNRLGLPVLTEAEGLDDGKLPAYNTLLYAWAAASALSIVREVPQGDRRWAAIGFAAIPLMHKGARHHFSWLIEQATTNPTWWNRCVQTQ
jgi:hypothetical protein